MRSWSPISTSNGAPDIVATGSGGGVALLNDGSGDFSSLPESTSADVRALAVGDVDGDGTLDRVAVDASDPALPAVTLAIGDGTGGFSPAVPIPGNLANDVALVDRDDDGDLDLVTAGSFGLWLHSNDGAGGFNPAGPVAVPCRTVGGYAPLTGHDVDVADLDADGDLDVAWTGMCEYPTGAMPVRWLVRFSPTGSEWTSWDLGAGRRIGIGTLDLDEDGNIDWAVANLDAPGLEVVIGRDPSAPGPIGSTIVLSVPTPGPVVAGDVTDIDGDGHGDLVVATEDSGVVSVLYGDGTGAFPESHASRRERPRSRASSRRMSTAMADPTSSWAPTTTRCPR